jgi:hypothetical protein
MNAMRAVAPPKEQHKREHNMNATRAVAPLTQPRLLPCVNRSFACVFANRVFSLVCARNGATDGDTVVRFFFVFVKLHIGREILRAQSADKTTERHKSSRTRIPYHRRTIDRIGADSRHTNNRDKNTRTNERNKSTRTNGRNTNELDTRT